MGLLDDAIREHLELKRLRGADTADVARQEQEAFGPSRRGDFEAASAEVLTATEEPFEHEAPTTLHAVSDAPPTPADPPAAQADPPPTQFDPRPGPSDPPAAPSDPSPPHGDPADTLPHAEALGEEQPVAEHPLREEPAPGPGGQPAGSSPEPDPEPEGSGQQTRAFDADEVRAASGVSPPVQPSYPEPEPEPEPRPAAPMPRADEQEAEGEEGADVLEETPEFLQETPEHDRLWFEQRPPRDFDF